MQPESAALELVLEVEYLGLVAVGCLGKAEELDQNQEEAYHA